MTIRRAFKVNTLEEYQVYSASENAKYSKSSPKNQSIPSLAPSSRWGNLRLFRQKLDDVLIDFILTEFENRHKEVMEENKKLKRKNQDLEAEVERLSQPDFVKSLQERLEIKEEEK